MGLYGIGFAAVGLLVAPWVLILWPRWMAAGHLSDPSTPELAEHIVTVGRALMTSPKLILLDEPSMGLAPLLVTEIFNIIKRLNEEEKVGMLLAEQNAVMALNYAEYGYIMENGRVVLDGDAATLRENADVREFYLGLTAVGKKSYRDVKHYHRRKRWLA